VKGRSHDRKKEEAPDDPPPRASLLGESIPQWLAGDARHAGKHGAKNLNLRKEKAPTGYRGFRVRDPGLRVEEVSLYGARPNNRVKGILFPRLKRSPGTGGQGLLLSSLRFGWEPVTDVVVTHSGIAVRG
jgi:hypothetical protein